MLKIPRALAVVTLCQEVEVVVEEPRKNITAQERSEKTVETQNDVVSVLVAEKKPHPLWISDGSSHFGDPCGLEGDAAQPNSYVTRGPIEARSPTIEPLAQSEKHHTISEKRPSIMKPS